MDINNTQEMKAWAQGIREIYVNSIDATAEKKLEALGEVTTIMMAVAQEDREVAAQYLQESFKEIGVDMPADLVAEEKASNEVGMTTHTAEVEVATEDQVKQ